MDSRKRFSNTVQDYVAARPGYAANLLEWIWEDAKLGKGDLIADIGSGTGISSRWLARSGLKVLACEPNLEMLDAARRSGDEEGRIEWIASDAESLDFGSRKVKAVVGGQSFHWLDLSRANRRFRQVLDLGGRVIAFWNVRDESNSTMHSYFEFLMKECPAFPDQEMKLADLNFGITNMPGDSASPQGLEDVHYSNLEGIQQEFSFDELVKRVWSSSYVRISVTDEEHFNSKLREFFEENQSEDKITFHYRSVIFSYLP